jgi:DNA mismatch endonuclease (patch repair protein)
MHGDPCCPDRREPQSNQDYWKPKLAMNRKRDIEQIAALQSAESAGWSVLTVWECETRDPATLGASVQAFLE